MKRTAISRKPSKKQMLDLVKRREYKTLLMDKQNGLCAKCKQKPDWRGLSLSHKKSLGQGGKTEVDNLELLCGVCHDSEHGIIDK